MLLQSSENSTKNYDSHIMFVFMNVFEKENKKGTKIILKNYECNVSSIIYSQNIEWNFKNQN